MVTKRLIIYCYQKINIDLFYSGCHQDTIWNFDPSSHKRLDKVHLSMGKQMIDEQKQIKYVKWTNTMYATHQFRLCIKCVLALSWVDHLMFCFLFFIYHCRHLIY